MLTNQQIDPLSGEQQRKPFILIRPFIAFWHWLVPPTLAHRDRQSPLAFWAARGSLIVVCLGMISGAFYYAKPIQDSYQNWKADRMVEESRRLAEDGQVVNAVYKAQEAYRIAPQNINALRLNTEFLAAMRRPEALFFLDRLEQEGGSLLQDRQTRVKALMNLGRSKDAADLLEKVLMEAPNDPLSMRLAEEVWGSAQKNDKLLKTLKNYAEQHPEDHAHSLRLARIQLAVQDTAERAAGMRRVLAMAQQDDALGLEALGVLDGFETLPPEESALLVRRLREHPKSGGWHYVSALKRELKMNPARKAELVQQAVALAQGKEREELVPMVRWLVEQQQFAQVLALVPEDEAKSYQPLLENYLTALTMLRRNEDLERLVMDPKVESLLSQSVRAFYRAHLAFVLHKPREDVRSALRLANKAADLERRGELCMKIAEYAEARGFSDIAEEAYRSAAANPRTDRAGYRGLIRATDANGNTEGLLAAVQESVRRWPDDSASVERLMYVNLLTGREVERMLVEARRLLEDRPNDPARQLLVALAAWRLMDYEALRQAMMNADIRPLSAGQKAVFAALARESRADNAQAAARQVIDSIDPKASMLPEERAALERAYR